jgi:hypothetical protein
MFVYNEIIQNSLSIHPAYVGDSLDKIQTAHSWTKRHHAK